MVEDSKVAARIPVQDLQRAESFYAEKLGLEPSEERPGGLLYRCGNGEFALFESAGAASGDHTQMGWEVGWSAMSEENERITRRDVWYGAALWDANNQIVALILSNEHGAK